LPTLMQIKKVFYPIDYWKEWQDSRLGLALCPAQKDCGFGVSQFK
jgi:hypothetical protein